MAKNIKRSMTRATLLIVIAAFTTPLGASASAAEASPNPVAAVPSPFDIAWDEALGMWSVSVMVPLGEAEGEQIVEAAESEGGSGSTDARETSCSGTSPVLKPTCGATVRSIQIPIRVRINAAPMYGDVLQTISTTTAVFAWKCYYTYPLPPQCSVLTANGFFFRGQTLTMSGNAPLPAVGLWQVSVFDG